MIFILHKILWLCTIIALLNTLGLLPQMKEDESIFTLKEIDKPRYNLFMGLGAIVLIGILNVVVRFLIWYFSN